jgi:hypothetical protein
MSRINKFRSTFMSHIELMQSLAHHLLIGSSSTYHCKHIRCKISH